jgi:hypothetical protein
LIRVLLYFSVLIVLFFIQPVSLTAQQTRKQPKTTSDTNQKNDIKESDSVLFKRLEQKCNNSKFLKELIDITFKDQEQPEQKELTDNTSRWLPFKGLVISHIIVKQPPPGSSFLPYISENDSSRIKKFIQKLHVYTRSSVIQKNLYVNSGDSLIPWLIADNEKLIRDLPYIENARFYPESVRNDSITLILVVQDNIPYGVFPVIYSASKQSLKIWNSNFLGFGNEVGFSLTNEKPDFYMSDLYFKLNNLDKRFIQNSIRYQRSLKQEYYTLTLERPYLPGAYKLAGGLELARKQENLPDYYTTQPETVLETRYFQANGWLGYQFKLNKHQPDKRPQYLVPAIGIYNTYFQKRPFVSADSNYVLNNFTRIMASVNWVNQNFVESDKLFAQNHPEALPVGFRLGLTFGYNWNEFNKMPYIGTEFRWSSLGKKTDYWVVSAGFGSYIQNQKLRQGAVKGTLYYLSNLVPLGEYTLRVLSGVNYVRGINRLSYDSLHLNNGRGITGLRTDALSGMQRINTELQFMLYTPWKWLGFSFTPYLLCEAGFIAEENEELFKNRLVTGLGIGLRLRNKFLVFSSIQLRLMYYPYTPAGAASWSFDLSDDLGWELFNFDPKQPDELIFR